MSLDSGPVYVLKNCVKQEIKKRYKQWVENGTAVKEYLSIPGVVFVELWLNKTEKIEEESDVWTSCFRLSSSNILGTFQSALLSTIDTEFGDTYITSSGSIQDNVPSAPDTAIIKVSSVRPQTELPPTPGRGSVFFDGFGASLTFDAIQEPDLLMDSFGGDGFGDNGTADTNKDNEAHTKNEHANGIASNSPGEIPKVNKDIHRLSLDQRPTERHASLGSDAIAPGKTKPSTPPRHTRHASSPTLSPAKPGPPVVPRRDNDSPATIARQNTQPNLFTSPPTSTYSVNDFPTTVPAPPVNANPKKLHPPIYMDVSDVTAAASSPQEFLLSPPVPHRPQLTQLPPPTVKDPTPPPPLASTPSTSALPIVSALSAPSAKPPMSPDLQFTPGLGRKPPPLPKGASASAVTAIFDKNNQAIEQLTDQDLQDSVAATKVLLGRNKLTAVPSVLSQFTQLQVLDLSYNRFDKLPTVLRFLANLKELQLQGNSMLTNAEDVKGLGDLSSLRKLDLSSNQISPEIATTFPEELFKLTRLETLNLSRNNLQSIPAEIEVFQNITCLEFIENSISEVPVQIGSLPALRKLNLSKNRIVEIPLELANAGALVEINLSDNQLTTLPANFAYLFNLSILNISNNQIEAIPAEILGGGATELCTNEDGSQFIPGIYGLTELRVRNNKLTSILINMAFDAFPFEVYYLEKLKRLDLSCNQIEYLPYSEETSISALVSLIDFNLASNRLKEVPEDICKLYSLEVLNLSANELTYLPADMWQLSSLRNLSIGYNYLSVIPFPPPEASWDSLDELFAAGNKELCEFQPFGKLASLRDLYLQGCGFTNVPFAPYVDQVPELEKVDLSFNKLDGATIAPELFRLDYLQRLGLSHNEFTQLPDELAEARRLEYLDISHNKLYEEPAPIKRLLREIGTEVISTDQIVSDLDLFTIDGTNSEAA